MKLSEKKQDQLAQELAFIEVSVIETWVDEKHAKVTAFIKGREIQFKRVLLMLGIDFNDYFQKPEPKTYDFVSPQGNIICYPKTFVFNGKQYSITDWDYTKSVWNSCLRKSKENKANF